MTDKKKKQYFVEVRDGKPVFRVSKGENRETISDKEHLVLFLRLYLLDYMNLVSLCLALMGSYEQEQLSKVELTDELKKDLRERRSHANKDLQLLYERFIKDDNIT